MWKLLFAGNSGTDGSLNTAIKDPNLFFEVPRLKEMRETDTAGRQVGLKFADSGAGFRPFEFADIAKTQA